MRIAPALVVVALMVIAVAARTAAQVPRTLAYQGVLTDTLGHPKPDGSYSLSFRLYDSPGGGSPIWNETKSLPLSHGLFSTTLGDQIPLNLPFDRPYWLGIQIGADPELAPRIPLSAAGYSLHSVRSDTASFALVAPQQGVVDSARIAGTVTNGAVTSGKIADGAVSTSKLADGTVTAAKISGGQVVRSLNGITDLVLLRAVGGATVSSSGDTLTINAGAGGGATGIQGIQNTNNTLDITGPNGPTTTINVKTAGVGTSQLADGSVTQAKIATGVSLPPNGSAGGDLTGSYPNPSVNALAITTSKIADNAVTGAKIAAGQVVKSINALTDGVTLAAGSNMSITPSGNTLTFSSSAGLTLPFAGLASSAQYAMDIRNSGTVGSAAGIYAQNNVTGNYGMVGTVNEGIFGFSSGTSTSASLRGNQFGSGLALEANCFGTGSAGSFRIVNASSSAAVVYATTSGTGSTGYFTTSNSANTAAVLSAYAVGPGPAITGQGAGQGSAGVFSITNSSNPQAAVFATSIGPGIALAASNEGTGRGAVFTLTSAANTNDAVQASTSGAGRVAWFSNSNSSFTGNAVEVVTQNGTGLLAGSNGSAGYGIVGRGYTGVFGTALVSGGTGVSAIGNQFGVNAFSGAVSNSVGIYGQANGSNSIAIQASGTNYGYWGQGGNIGLYAHNTSGSPGRDVYLATPSLAADMYGDLYVHGSVTKAGGSFKIDHPLDPANKYLYHSFVESPDMKNIYDGVVTLDGSGQATVALPDWFEALNRDFRYQLTAIGAPGPNLHVSQKILRNRFAIAGGTPGMEVSWQVTGIRQDAWANAHRIPVEEVKSPAEHGHYDYPELFGQSADKSIHAALHPQTSGMQTDQAKTQQGVEERAKGAGK